jgi:hypothetical protein
LGFSITAISRQQNGDSRCNEEVRDTNSNAIARVNAARAIELMQFETDAR